MRSRRPFLFRSLVSIIDQVLLSGLNFMIGIALIRYASKETYGLYSQLFGVGLLITTLLEAMIGSALTTLSARLTSIDRSTFLARAARIQWAASAIYAVIAGLGVGILVKTLDLSEDPLLLALSFGAFIFTLASREYCRTALFIDLRPDLATKMDFIFVLTTVFGAALIFLAGHVSLTQVISLLAASNGVAAMFYSGTLIRGIGPSANWQQYIDDISSLWALSQWALAGSVLGWIGNNSYLYFVGGLVGIAALADLNAARLLLMPIVIVGMAWSRVARPTMGQLIASSDWPKLRHFATRSILAIEGITAAYVLALIVSFPWLSSHVLHGKYENILTLLLLWGCYFGANAARNVGTMLLTSFGAFRALFWQGLVSVLFLVMAWAWWIPQFGVIGGISAMIVVELGELLANHLYLIPRAKVKLLALE